MATKTASASLEDRLKANPDSLSFSRVAEYFRTSGDIARAIDICVSGNRKHPEYVTGRIVLGRCYADLDNFEEAVKALTSACMLDRRNMVAMKMLADIFLRLGSREKAGDIYALLAAMDPWNATLSRLAAQTPGSRDADLPAILSLSPSEELQGPTVTLQDMPPRVMENVLKDTLNDASQDKPQDKPQDLLQEALGEVLPEVAVEKGPGAEADAAAQKAVTQEVARADLGITEAVPEEKDEAVLETAENITKSGEEALFEATTVTGTDITDRMAMLFGEKDAGEKPATEEAPPLAQESPAAVTEATVETIEVQPVDAIPDGNTISSRIDELFSRDTLKIPAIKEVAQSDAPKDALLFEKKGPGATDEDVDATIQNSQPFSSGEADFEETMIMDAVEVKDFLREDKAEPEPLQKMEPGGDESGAARETPPDLISDAFQPSAETALPGELVVDEQDAGGGNDLLKTGPLAAMAAPDDTVTGDDVVRLMSGFFEGQEDKAISEVVGPETIDDFFEGAGLVVEPLPGVKGPGEIETIAGLGDEKASLIQEAEQGEKTAMSAADGMVSGDDVVKRIDRYFGKRETEPEDAPSDAPSPVDSPTPAIEEPAAIDFPAFPAAGAPQQSWAEESEMEATIVEGDVENAIASPEIKERESGEEAPLSAAEESNKEATIVAGDIEDTMAVTKIKERESGEGVPVPAADDTISGDDVAGRIASIFSDSEEVRRAAMAGFLPKDGETDKGPGIDDTRVVDAGRPSETDVIEDTVAENAAGIISGADIEERLEEYFHDAADRTAAKKSIDEEVTYPDLPEGPGTMVDKKADYEETIIADDDASDGASVGASSGASAGLSIDQIAADETASAELRSEYPVTDEEAIVETVDSLEETLEAEDTGDREETQASKKTEDREATAVFTNFSAGSVSNAPPVPPEVPLFTLEKPRMPGEETQIIEIPALPAPEEPDIPDHVLTPTLADIYLQQGQPKLALTIYRRLQEKNPDNEKLGARVKEIEKALAEGTLPAAPAEQKTAAVKGRKKAAAKSGAHAREPRSEDKRPLAGVRLKKKPKLNWRKK